MAARPRILSGVQPSGRLHLGNYFGAIRQHIELQEEAECFYFIANYHSLTTLRDGEALLRNTRDVAMTYLAVGLDPDRAVFYRQSDVPEVAELTWLLSTVTAMGLLERAHSYKEKVTKGHAASVGLFLYPCLMAADILAPQGEIVPVGQDQKQHVEMARDMAQSFHAAFCQNRDPVFTLPEPRFSSDAARVPGTTLDKGQVLQLNLMLRGARGLEVEDVVRRVRGQLADVVAAAPEGTMDTTEAIEGMLSEHVFSPIPELAGDAVATASVRTLAEAPGRDYAATPSDGGKLHVEFAVPVDRVVFVTSGGRRQAAKMSKSYGNTIEIFAEGKALKKSVMGIETLPKELHEPLEPEGDLVLDLFSLFAEPAEVEDMAAKYRAGGFGYGNAKKALLAKVDEWFAPFRARRRELESDPDTVEDVLREGARKAREVIRATVDDARSACGISARMP